MIQRRKEGRKKQEENRSIYQETMKIKGWCERENLDNNLKQVKTNVPMTAWVKF